MRNIAKRSVALLLFVAMALSVCQGVVVPTFAGDTVEGTVSTVATDPPDSGGGAEETSTVATEGVGDETENSSTEVSEPTEVTEPVEDTTNPSVPDESLGTDEPSEEGTEQTEPVTNPSEPESGESSESSETASDGDNSGFWLDVGDILVPTVEEDSGSVMFRTLPGGTDLSISRKDYYTPFPGGVKFYFVSDISGTNGGWYAWSQSIATQQTVNLVLDTIRLAMKNEKKRVATKLQLHSDQGFQYTSHGYFKLTQSYGITPSMSRKGNPYDNAMAENFFSILKTECIYRHKPKTLKEANDLIDRYIHFYNHERIQNKTGVAPLTLRHSA